MDQALMDESTHHVTFTYAEITDMIHNELTSLYSNKQHVRDEEKDKVLSYNGGISALNSLQSRFYHKYYNFLEEKQRCAQSQSSE